MTDDRDIYRWPHEVIVSDEYWAQGIARQPKVGIRAELKDEVTNTRQALSIADDISNIFGRLNAYEGDYSVKPIALEQSLPLLDKSDQALIRVVKDSMHVTRDLFRPPIYRRPNRQDVIDRVEEFDNEAWLMENNSLYQGHLAEFFGYPVDEPTVGLYSREVIYTCPSESGKQLYGINSFFVGRPEYTPPEILIVKPELVGVVYGKRGRVEACLSQIVAAEVLRPQ